MPNCLLDELVFLPGPLGELPPSLMPCLDLQIAVGTSGRTYQQPVPLFSHRSSIKADHPTWPGYCKLLKELGVTLRTSKATLELLPTISQPSRWASRAYDEALRLSEVQSAQAIEIDCLVEGSRGPWARLPLEIHGWHELKLHIECLRDLAGPETPIGLRMLAGDIYTDVSNAVAARVDFIVLELAHRGPVTGAVLNYLAWSVAAARHAASQSELPGFPILWDAPVEDTAHLLKLLALGASAVSIDTVVQSALPKLAQPETSAPKGLLSGIGALPLPTRTVNPLDGVARRLNALLEQLRYQLLQLQLSSLRQLKRDHLRALAAQATGLCGVKPLEI